MENFEFYGSRMYVSENPKLFIDSKGNMRAVFKFHYHFSDNDYVVKQMNVSGKGVNRICNFLKKGKEITLIKGSKGFRRNKSTNEVEEFYNVSWVEFGADSEKDRYENYRSAMGNVQEQGVEISSPAFPEISAQAVIKADKVKPENKPIDIEAALLTGKAGFADVYVHKGDGWANVKKPSKKSTGTARNYRDDDFQEAQQYGVGKGKSVVDDDYVRRSVPVYDPEDLF